MANLECFVDFDDEWIQDGCHWKYDRIFTITWKINNIDNITAKEFYYRLGPYSSSYRDYEQVFSPQLKTTSGSTRSWTYEIRLSNININTLLKARSQEGWIKITAYLKTAGGLNSNVIDEAHYTFDYFLELPPKPVENLKTDLVIDSPGELICSWDAAATIDNNDADSVDGYTVEVKRCLAGDDYTKDENYFYIGNLAWESMALASGKYKLIKTDEAPVDTSGPDVGGEITTFVNDLVNTEAHINGANNTHFYFEPELLGIEKGDYYKFIIYPHSHYASEYTLIAPAQEDATDPMEVSKGTVRVFNGTSWVEGQVWVFTDNGWVVADSIYVMTEDENGNKGWKITA